MYYKVMKNERVIDVLDKLVFLKYQPKHKRMLLCEPSEAQAVLSSDSNTIWHESTLPPIPAEGYDTVTIKKIDKYEYQQLKVLNGRTPEEIIDSYTLMLIEEGVL